MATYLGVVGGSSFLKSNIFTQGHWEIQTVATPYGDLKYYIDAKKYIIFVQRHAANPKIEYTPPHSINKKSIIWGLKQLGCSRVIALASTGTMNSAIALGSVVVPNDFLCLDRINFYDDYRGHNVPGFDEDFRQEVLKTLTAAKISHVADASYFQSSGPRFETASEIKLFANVCDIVGMTTAQEAVLAREISLPFVAICMVDNLANGLKQTSLTFDDFHHGVADNLQKVEQLLSLLLTTFAPKLEDQKKDSRTVVDKIVRARWVLPMTADSSAPREERVLEHHSIAVHANGEILAILPHAAMESQYTSSNIADLSENHVVLPGFINCHTHLGMSMLRGFGDDHDLQHWLNQYIWPTEGKFVSPDFVTAGSLLGIVELLKSGTTCVNDMYFIPRALKDVLLKTGFRGVIGAPVFDLPNEEAGANMLAENGKAIDDYLAEAKASIAKHPDDVKANKKYDLITHTIAPHAPYTVTDATLAKCLALAKSKDIPIHVHLHETLKEVEDSIHLKRASAACHRSDNAVSPIENFAKLGFFDHKIICAHMTTIQEGPQWDLVISNKERVKIAHCPCSNMKLASGFCPTPALIAAGVDVGIGTDSSGSNNSLDMCAELKMAALIAKGHSGNPKAIPAYTALQMATSLAAKTIHLDHKIGTLDISKKADFIAINLSNIPSLPLYDVISQIVYATTRDMVEYVWINGEEIVKNKVIHSGLEAEAKKLVQHWNPILKEFKDGIENESANHGLESPTSDVHFDPSFSKSD